MPEKSNGICGQVFFYGSVLLHLQAVIHAKRPGAMG